MRHLSVAVTTALATIAAVVASLAAGATPPAVRTDVRGDAGTGPDVTAVSVSSTRGAVTFRIRFAVAPPLRVSTSGGWADMLLVGIDTPPFRATVRPGREWRGIDYALGTHGPAATGMVVRLGNADGALNDLVARIPVTTRGTELTMVVPRTAFGPTRQLAYTVVAAREGAPGEEGTPDLVPERGTVRVVLAG